MEAGDTFYLPDKAADGHLWIVISDPRKNPDRVLLVSMTSYDVDSEDVCLIDAGEHPRVKHKTCICYKPARATSLVNLRRRSVLSRAADNAKPPWTGKLSDRKPKTKADNAKPPWPTLRPGPPSRPSLLPARTRVQAQASNQLLG